MFFDTNDRFWTDPNTNRRVPYDKWDLQATATHEFGHATGWGPHFDDDGSDSDDKQEFRSYCRSFENQDKADDQYTAKAGERINKSKQTMCANITAGTASQRTLGSHDRGTFNNAFGPR